MLPTNDMLTPATKADLREAIDDVFDKLRQDIRADRDAARAETREAIQTAIDKLRQEVKADRDTALDTWAGALRAELASKQDLRALGTQLRTELASKQELHATVDRLRTEMRSAFAKLTRVVQESTYTHFTVIDDKYADLPPRVARLEAKVFPPRRTRRR